MLVENVYGYNDELLVAGVWHSGAPVVDVFCIIINIILMINYRFKIKGCL